MFETGNLVRYKKKIHRIFGKDSSEGETKYMVYRPDDPAKEVLKANEEDLDHVFVVGETWHYRGDAYHVVVVKNVRTALVTFSIGNEQEITIEALEAYNILEYHRPRKISE